MSQQYIQQPTQEPEDSLFVDDDYIDPALRDANLNDSPGSDDDMMEDDLDTAMTGVDAAPAVTGAGAAVMGAAAAVNLVTGAHHAAPGNAVVGAGAVNVALNANLAVSEAAFDATGNLRAVLILTVNGLMVGLPAATGGSAGIAVAGANAIPAATGGNVAIAVPGANAGMAAAGAAPANAAPSTSNATAASQRTHLCGENGCTFRSETARGIREHRKNMHLGTTCYWVDENDQVCGFTSPDHRRVYNHFNGEHLRKNGLPPGPLYTCLWPGHKGFYLANGTYIPPEPPCGRRLDLLGSAERHAREHQHRIWRQA